MIKVKTSKSKYVDAYTLSSLKSIVDGLSSNNIVLIEFSGGISTEMVETLNIKFYRKPKSVKAKKK